MMQPLSEVISYTNDDVLEKFREEYYFSKEESEEVFSDVLHWLWLTANSPPSSGCAMYHTMLAMDKMWHTFFSFMKDYEDFCNKYFGKIIYHTPHTRNSMIEGIVNSESQIDSLSVLYNEVGKFQEYTYDTLGSEILLRWFVTYPHIYSAEEMLRRSRPQFSQRGFLILQEMRKMDKTSILQELAKSHAVAAWCGGPNCGAQCREN